ncbi:hypothetical protein GCM10025868_07710 [Angustibacter aerolatus]|uniref:Riboflavin kinase domain-containing protein n=1 Tax=Angustibacter aerolatus TaxID=1162965 RepID=A0ABQ6JFH6_9ACTN|nr:hypothetical protein GCM10025868_07710 [Angustibacter aerolatus]
MARLRETLRFESVDDLLVQMEHDVAECRDLLSSGLVPTPSDG